MKWKHCHVSRPTTRRLPEVASTPLAYQHLDRRMRSKKTNMRLLTRFTGPPERPFRPNGLDWTLRAYRQTRGLTKLAHPRLETKSTMTTTE